MHTLAIFNVFFLFGEDSFHRTIHLATTLHIIIWQLKGLFTVRALHYISYIIESSCRILKSLLGTFKQAQIITMHSRVRTSRVGCLLFFHGWLSAI